MMKKKADRSRHHHHQPHEAIRAAGVADVYVFDVHRKKLRGKREAWRYSDCVKLFLDA